MKPRNRKSDVFCKLYFKTITYRLLNIKPSAYQVSSISKLIALHNNYILETNVNEHVTAQERAEENALLDAVLGTSVMQYARSFLVQKGLFNKIT